MPQTCFAWAEDEDRSAAETGLAAALGETTATTSGDTITIPDIYPFVAGVLVGTEFPDYFIVDARLASPGIGGPGVNNWRFHKAYRGDNGELDTAAIGVRDEGCMYNFMDNPIRVGEGPNGIAGDTLTAYSLETDETGVAHFNSIVLFVTDTKLPLMPHNLTHIVKFTTGAVTTAVTWANLALTLDDDIPPGRYTLWGADVTSATAIAARLQIPGVPFRPAFVPKRVENENFSQPNRCLHPGGIPIVYKGGTLNVRLDLLAETTDTPLSGALYLEYTGK
jgi:hypothetical protein